MNSVAIFNTILLTSLPTVIYTGRNQRLMYTTLSEYNTIYILAMPPYTDTTINIPTSFT